MLVLLPPSEGKAEGTEGLPLDLEALSLPGLAEARATVLNELSDLCVRAPDRAREVLRLSERQTNEITKNTALRTAPTLPATELYTGVLYDALGLGSLSEGARIRAEQQLLVFSGLWGAVRITDRLPSYRCSAGVRLPALGGLGPFWRGPLSTVLPGVAGDGLVLDLRSTAYTDMWKPTGDTAKRTAGLRVLQARTADGVEKRSVVSHFNKATKGRIVRALLESGADPAAPEELAEELRGLGYRVEAGGGSGVTNRLDVVVTDL